MLPNTFSYFNIFNLENTGIQRSTTENHGNQCIFIMFTRCHSFHRYIKVFIYVFNLKTFSLWIIINCQSE